MHNCLRRQIGPWPSGAPENKRVQGLRPCPPEATYLLPNFDLNTAGRIGAFGGGSGFAAGFATGFSFAPAASLLRADAMASAPFNRVRSSPHSAAMKSF